MYATASSKPQLLGNPNFDEWSGGNPSDWTHESTTNATYTQLQKSDSRGAVARTVFGQDLRHSDADYIYAGENGFRVTMASAASAGDWIIRQGAASAKGVVANPKQHLSVVVVPRCSVENNLLNVRIIALDDTTDAFHLVPVGGTYFPGRTRWQWVATATDIPITMKTRWHVHGFELPGLPGNVTSVSVRIANGSAGAQVIDMGEVSMVDNLDQLGGAEV